MSTKSAYFPHSVPKPKFGRPLLYDVHSRTELFMGWVDPCTGWVGLGWAGSRFFKAFWWVGLGRGRETFPKILKFGRPLLTAKVIPDNPITINTDK